MNKSKQPLTPFQRRLRALISDSSPQWLRDLVCRLTGHQWQVIYTDDDQCKCCRNFRVFPGGEIVKEIRRPPLSQREAAV